MTRKARGKRQVPDLKSFVTVREPRRERTAADVNVYTVNSEEYSSFIEIIEYDENGQEKRSIPVVTLTETPQNSQLRQEPTIQSQQGSVGDQSFSSVEIIEYVDKKEKPSAVESTDCATTSTQELEEDKENSQQQNELLNESPAGESDDPVSIFIGNAEEPPASTTPEKSSVKHSPKKRGGGKRKKGFVENIDPSLLKLPSVSCFKSSSTSTTRKSFRFADTRGEGPLVECKEVDYEEINRYALRQTTIKKTQFSEVI